MKLLFYLPGLVDGGAERVMANLANWFARQGHEVTLVVDFSSGKNHPPLDPSVQFMQLSQNHYSSIQQLASLLRDQRPNIAISAIASANFKLVAASLLARGKNLTNRRNTQATPHIVLTYHGFEEYKTGKLSWLGYQALPLMSRHASAVIAVSKSLKEVLENRWKARTDNLLCIYNPVSIPPLPATTKPIDLDSRAPIVLSVGRLVPDKRFDLLIKGFALLKDHTSQLIIAGDGPERQKLQQLIDQLDLSKRVKMPGYITDTGPLYAQAKCLALTSVTESFGLVLVEAMAYGLPVIATDCGGPREVLDNGRYGDLLKTNPTENEIAQTLQRVLENPGDPAPRIKRAKSFDMETGARQYEALFTQIRRQSS